MEMRFRQRVAYDRDKFDIEYGRHSNIPDCCIAFWISEFEQIYENAVLREDYNRKQAATEHRIKRSYNYRPCHDCLQTGHWQPIHTCRGACKDTAERLRDKYALTPQWSEYVEPQ